jgi:hypothetical protein
MSVVKFIATDVVALMLRILLDPLPSFFQGTFFLNPKIVILVSHYKLFTYLFWFAN